MPTTVNGVGTHYYGRKHRHDRKAVCQSCGRAATLSSFETRLWVVIVFIPVIPLGRKRITDQCSLCSRHYVLPAKQWETARQTQISHALDQFRQSPSEESALMVHGTLLAFQQHDEATEFRRQMLERFHDKALLPAGLALHLENNGLPDEALALWNKAYDLDPELPEARIGVARHRMFEGQLDEARSLLKFLEEPGAEQQYNLEPLFQLSSVMQQKNQHTETLEIVEVLLKAFPHLATDRKFRKFVSKSEKAVKQQESLLPEVNHSIGKLFTPQYSSAQRWVVGLSIALILAVVGLAVNNEYMRRHRPLTILNATGGAVTVQVDGQEPVSVSGSDKHVITVSEGSHVVSVSGPVTEQHTIDISSDYLSRWTSTPVWIINVGGEAVIVDVTVYYAVQPQKPDVRLVTDTVFIRSHVDYPFEEPPQSIELSNANSVLSKTSLSWFNPEASPGGALAGYLTLKTENPQHAWEFAKRKLRRHPDDEQLLAYLANDLQRGQQAELAQLLEETLRYRPVLIRSHRIYQDLPEVSVNYKALIARYDAMLAEEPDNADLLYLRGRIDADDEKQRRFLSQAREADPDLAWLDYSAGFDAMSSGQWDEALQLLQLAVKKGLPEQLDGIQHFLMMALGQFEEAESMHRAILKETPGHLATAISLAEALVRQKRSFEADQILSDAITSFTVQSNGNFAAHAQAAKSLKCYFKGELTEAVQEASGISDPALYLIRAMMLVEQGEMDQAVQLLSSVDQSEQKRLLVLCSLGYFAIGDFQHADEYYQKAIDHFVSMGPRYSSLTTLVKSEPTLNTFSDMLTITADPSEKAALLTLLGTRTDSQEIRESLFAGARQMMIQLMPPRGLLENIHAMEVRLP